MLTVVLLPMLTVAAIEVEDLPARVEAAGADLALGWQERAVEARIGPRRRQRGLAVPRQRQQMLATMA
mgnify:CR=1 FL=1